jgi:hypothetical protein
MNRHLRNLIFATGIAIQLGATVEAHDRSRVRATVQGDQPGIAIGQAWQRSEVFDAAYYRDHFRMYLRIRRKNADPSLTPDAVRGGQLVAALARGGTPYSECILSRIVDRDPDFMPDLRRLDFGVAVENVSGDVKAPRGTCDTDLSTASVQRGVPNVLAGDTVAVRLVGGGATGQTVAQGSFAAFP